MYKAIKTSSVTLVPEIIDVEFIIKVDDKGEDWIHISKGAITGYESAQIRELMEQYIKRSCFASWTANFGTLNKYSKLEVPMSEILRFLLDRDLVTVTKDYGYIKSIEWKEAS